MFNEIISQNIWDVTYRVHGENSISDTLERVARNCASVEPSDIREEKYKEFLWLLSDFRGSTGGRITANIGVDELTSTTLYNCFVHNAADLNIKDIDSINGIFSMLKSQAHTLKSEGGYGTNFSWIRPRGTYIRGIGARTPGVIKFMELWDKSAEIITMGDDSVSKLDSKTYEKKKIRKGAQMGVLCCWHPDIEQFINAKLIPGKFTKFNISVGITSGFMQAVLNDDSWDLKFPDTSFERYDLEWSGDLEKWESKNYPIIVYKTIKAKTLWESIMKATYSRNDPGVIFLDIANKMNPLSYAENIMATNPCFSENTMIAVADGRNLVSIKQLAKEDKDVPVYSLNKETGMIEIKMGRHPRVTGYNKKLLRVHLDDQSYIDVTPDHKFVLLDGTIVEAQYLKPGYSLPRFTKDLEPVKTGSKDYYRIYTNTKNQEKDKISEYKLISQFYKKDEIYNKSKQSGLDSAKCDPRALQTCLNMREQGYKARVENNIVYVTNTCEICKNEFEIDHDHRETKVCSEPCRLAYLDRYYSNKADENKREQCRVYSALKFDLNRKPLRKEWELKCKEEEIPFRLGKTMKYGFKSFKELSSAAENYNHKVVRIEELDGLHTVYNITVDDNHTVAAITSIRNKRNNNWYSGILLPNCGEITMGTGVCLLFSLNLVKYIKKEDDRYCFDFDTFKKAVSIATRLADNVNDISKTPLPEYHEAILDKRRIGLGVIGLGSLHYMLGIRYGSEESLKLINDIFKAKAETEILASAKLGKEKGSFRLFDRDKYFSSYWWKTIPISEEVKKEVEQIGEMRNSHHAANAPTGNMSLYLGCVSNGIEPVIWREYDRWITVSDFEKASLKEEGLEFPDVLTGEWFETNIFKESQVGTDEVLFGTYNGDEYQVDKNRGLTKKVAIKDYGWAFVQENYTKEEIDIMEHDGVFASIDDLNINEHIGPLKVITKYVNMNSSKTVNIPNDYSYDDFKDLYMDAWKNNIKGITSYRAGTMVSVMENKDSIVRPAEIKASFSPKRPECLLCDIHTTSIKGNKWLILVGLLNNNPYEIFLGLSQTLCLPSKYKTGRLCKDGSGIYNLHVDVGEEELVINNVVKVFDNPDSAWATRMISISLRHGVPVEFIVEQLSKDGGIGDINKAISRVLKKYISEGKKPFSKIRCDNCGSDDIVFIEGCISCKRCSWSKCN